MQEIQIPENPLENGASLKIPTNRMLIIFGKKFFLLSFGMPTLGTHILIQETFSKHNITSTDLLDTDKFKEIFSEKRYVLYKLVAIAILNGYFKSKLFGSLFAVWLKCKVSPEQVYTILNMYMNFGGTNDFVAVMKSILSVRYTDEGMKFGQSKEGVKNG